MQLIYGTQCIRKYDTCWECPPVTLKTFWLTIKLCIYYYHISSMHKTILNSTDTSAEVQLTCTQLLAATSTNWTTNGKVLIAALNDQLSEYPAIDINPEFYSVRIPSMLKQTQDRKTRLAANYISLTLFALTTADENKENLFFAKRDLAANNSLLHCGSSEEETGLIHQILLDETLTHGISSTQWLNLLATNRMLELEHSRPVT
jgi:hypothetical protein